MTSNEMIDEPRYATYDHVQIFLNSERSVNILNAKNLAPPFLSIFFWLKIDDFKNQCSLVFMPVQMTIVAEKIKCVGNYTCIFLGEKCI